MEKMYFNDEQKAAIFLTAHLLMDADGPACYEEKCCTIYLNRLIGAMSSNAENIYKQISGDRVFDVFRAFTQEQKDFLIVVLFFVAISDGKMTAQERQFLQELISLCDLRFPDNNIMEQINNKYNVAYTFEMY